MSRSPENFKHNTQLAVSAVDVVSAVADNTKMVIRKLSFYNSNTTTDRSVTVYVVETSGSADTGTTAVSKSISPLKTWNVIEVQGEVLSAGMSLKADQDVGTDVNVNCSGAKVQ